MISIKLKGTILKKESLIDVKYIKYNDGQTLSEVRMFTVFHLCLLSIYESI